jgi:hypothetical protein
MGEDVEKLVERLIRQHVHGTTVAGPDGYLWPGLGLQGADKAAVAIVAALASSTPELSNNLGELAEESAVYPDERPLGDSAWTRFRDEKPTHDGCGERNLLTWNVRSATYDHACIDGEWRAGEEIDGHADDLWRWLDVNPERHLPAAPAPACVNHPGRTSLTNLDGDELCLECANAWARGEGEHAAYLEAQDRP